MKKLILKSEINKMKLSNIEMDWIDNMQDPENNRLFFAYTYCGPIATIPTMYSKAVAYFAKSYIKSTGGDQASFNKTCQYVAQKFGIYSTSGISRTLKGQSANGKNFIVSDIFGLDCITLR